MKKSYFFVILFFFSIYSISFAQSNNYLGVGTSIDFNKSIASTTNSNSSLKPTDLSLNNYSIQTYLNLNSEKAFQFRVNARINAKTTQFASEELADFGELMINTLNHGFFAVDMGLTGLYAIPLNENNKLLPALGVFGSYNFSLRSYTLSREDRLLTNEELLNKLPLRTNNSNVFYVGLNTGLLYQTTIKGRLVEFYSMFYFSPTDSFETTFEYENIDSMTYKGKHQSLAFGINVPIFLKNNQPKNE